MQEIIPSFEMRNVTTQKTNNGLIHDFSMRVLPGEVYGIISTQSFALENLLSVFKTEVAIVQGDVRYRNKPVTMQRLQNRKNIMSIITGRDYLYPSFSAYDNIFFFDPKYVHGHRMVGQERCVDFLNRYNIQMDLSKRAIELTREERKMVEIIRAYMCESKLIIMHETFSRVTDMFAAQFASVLEDWKKQGTSIIYLSTQLSDALAISDRISIFNDGQIKTTVSSAEAKINPQRLISLLSGGEPMAEPEEREQELLSIISSARDIMSTNKDMKKMLQYLAANLKRIKNALGCVIYVIDEKDKLVFSSEQTEENMTRLTPAALYDLAKNFEDSPSCFTPEDSNFHAYFINTEEVVRIYCFSIFVRYDIRAMIQLSFDRQEIMDEKDVQLVSTFCREVKIAIESSLILEHSSLLQESHHRIKNNLQSIIGLIYMQKYKLQNEETIERSQFVNIIDSIINRIKSIAAIHDLLSKDRFGWKNIDLIWLTRRILQFYDQSDMQFELNMENIYIPYGRATSFALIINELISNSMKHAFAGMKENKQIRITCQTEKGKLHLCVADNGVGIAQPFDIETQSNIGMSIIRSIAQELDAELYFNNFDGTTVDLLIPTDSVYRI